MVKATCVALERLASRRLTVIFFVAAAVASLQVGTGGKSATVWMAVPFLVLVVNVAAAIVVHPRLRADAPLLALHLALLALVMSVAWSRLTYFDAQVALLQGVTFSGRLEKVEHGPWHEGTLDHLVFIHEGATMHYDPAGTYLGTDNLVTWLDVGGFGRQSIIGDDRPLLIDGYRIYAVKQRGLALLFRWQAPGQAAELGGVNLPDHRKTDYPPSQSWTLGNGLSFWVQIRQAPWAPPADGREVDFGAPGLDHVAVIRQDDRRFELRPGESIDLPEGRLTYLRLATWMGYRVVHDPAAAWILASTLVAVGSLAWFYARRLLRVEKLP